MSYEEIIEENRQLKIENESIKFDLDSYKFRIAQLEKLIFGAKRERHTSSVDPAQLSLFDTPQQGEDQSAEQQVIYTRKKQSAKSHPGRNELPAHLPTDEVVIEPEELSEDMVRIGEDVTETLDYKPASLRKRRTVRPIYTEPSTDKIYQAPPVDRPLMKSIAESSLLAHIITEKFVNHMPFYRKIQDFERQYDWRLSSSTVNDWFREVCLLLERLYEELNRQVICGNYIQMDESPIKVQDGKKKGKTHQGYMWVARNPINGLVLFKYSRGRGQTKPNKMLRNYSGYLQCDGYGVYDKIGKRSDIQLVGCMAHVRRKYHEAQKSDPQRSKFVLDIFRSIYLCERTIRNQSDETLRSEKRGEIRILLKGLRDYIDEECTRVIPKSPLGKAMSYTIGQWSKLMAIFEDNRLELDNNHIENKIRPLALGRKNYLFAGSHEGAERNAMMYSFMASCKAKGVNPYTWLNKTLDVVAETKLSRLAELLP